MIDAPREASLGRHAAPPRKRRLAALAVYAQVHLLLVPALLFAAAWSLQHSRFDMAIASAFFEPGRGFPWRHSAWLEVIGHEAARGLPILVAGLSLAAWALGHWVGPLRPWRRILLATGAAMLVGPLLINAMKTLTSQHCPSDIRELGGIVAYAADRAAPFWAASRESAGRCLPSGHAGGGYALFCLYFAGWAAGRPAWRWAGLAVAIACGLGFSIVRVMQGAHFASATMWSATIDWSVCALLFAPLLCPPAPPAR